MTCVLSQTRQKCPSVPKVGPTMSPFPHRRLRLRLLLAAGWLAVAGHHASAQTQISSSSSSLLTGATVISFETVTAGSAYSSLTVSGVTFSAEATKFITVDSSYAGVYNNSGQSLQNTYSGTAFGNLTITFATPVSAFGFNWGASDATWTLTAFDASNNTLEAFALPITSSSNAGEFYGLGGYSTAIAKATLVGPTSDYIFVDNFKFVAVPEPSVCALALGVAALAVMAGRKRRSR